MKLNKILIATSILAPAAVTPLGVMTSCSATTWGHKTPLSIGSVSRNSVNNPYYNFIGQDLRDLDGQNIPSYLQSNYIVDAAKNVNYAYTTPVKTWSKDNRKLPTDQWVDDTSLWATSSTNFSTSFTDADKKAQTNYKNMSLLSNISFVDTIGQFLNKYITYGLSYATSQISNQQNLATAWGGVAPTGNTEGLYELMFANSNCHVANETEVFFKTTAANFNFVDFPIPAYNADKSISAATVKLLSGQTDVSKLSIDDNAYWSTKSVQNAGKDDAYTVYTFPAVPVLIRTKGLTQRYINPKVNTGSYFVNDYYQTDNAKIKNAIGSSWQYKQSSGSIPLEPTASKFELKTTQEAKTVNPIGDNKDARLHNVKGSDFIAFVTYSYTLWDKPNADRINSITLSSLQTIMPAYLLQYKNDLYVKANTKNDKSAYIIDVNKADKYSTELINLLSRNSDAGRTVEASKLDENNKNYLKFLYFLFAKEDSFAFNDFATPTPFN